jgi:hypothetical protein
MLEEDVGKLMKEILAKLSSYNIFNYLFPGVIFAVISSNITSFNLTQDDILAGAFVYYFIGLVISRIGSLILEPVLLNCKAISFAPYEDFIQASKNDPKLETLSEVNNMYRTICAMLISISIIYGYDQLAQISSFMREYAPIFCVVSLFAMFVFSYRKQTTYIVKRISASKSK